jgi:RHS repeat-associated protein
VEQIDDLTYNYLAGTNKLTSVTDPIAAGLVNYDIDGQAANNYSYDRIGNMTADNAEGITNISWTVYGKIKNITKSNGTIEYRYDASGNRIYKKTVISGATTETYYARDAQGNVMAVYEKQAANPLKWMEQHLYGSSRLGMWNLADVVPGTTVPASGGTVEDGYLYGSKFFELSNHLGNVLVTVSDKKIGIDDGGNGTTDYFQPEVLTAQDYYSGGMEMPGRQYSGTNIYRYGFNSKEKDNRDGVVQYDYGFRIYDPRLVRFKSVDPLTKSYPWYTPYQFAGNKPIACIDLDGLEELWVTNNCFAPFDLFGTDFFGSYSGDGEDRKFGDGGTYRTSGTAHINLTTSQEPKFIAGNSVSTYHRKLGADYTVKSPSRIEETNYYSSENRNYHHLQMHVSGPNKAAPPIVTPDIDNHVNIYFEKNPQDKSKVLVHGNVQGDHFPANETILSDNSGNNLILGVSGPGAGRDIGPYTLLWGDSKRNMYSFRMTILFNDDDTFKAVELNGKQYSIEEWNRRFDKLNSQSTSVKTTTNNSDGTTQIKEKDD